MKTALYISYLNIALNILLATVKLIVGTMSGSEALVSDGLHAAVDVLSSFVVLIGIRLSARCCDRRHPYGHERMECVAAVLLAVLVGVTGVGIGVSGMRSVLGENATDSVSPGYTALIVALISILIKETMFRYTRYAARRVGSGALMADAWHMRSDALSSMGGFAGVLGANLGVAVLDPLAAVIISVFIIKAAVTIFTDAMRKMTDCACEPALENTIDQQVRCHPQVIDVYNLKTRMFGSRVMVEVTVSVEGTLSCKQAFTVAREISEQVCCHSESVKECAVHIHPL